MQIPYNWFYVIDKSKQEAKTKRSLNKMFVLVDTEGSGAN